MSIVRPLEERVLANVPATLGPGFPLKKGIDGAMKEARALERGDGTMRELRAQVGRLYGMQSLVQRLEVLMTSWLPRKQSSRSRKRPSYGYRAVAQAQTAAG